MKYFKQLLLYAGLIVIFGGLIFYMLHDSSYNTPSLHQIKQVDAGKNVEPGFFTHLFRDNIHEALPRLLLQVLIIMVATSLFGLVFRKIGQPAVVGETVAGIVLGPSLLGLLFPDVFHFIFPAESLPTLRFLSQIGLILFMFIVGLELDHQMLRKQAFEAVIISHASIVIPFTLGIFISFFLYPLYASTHSGFYSFALFMGIAMSITAFPVLARIIRDRKMTDSRLGILAISCAASDDVTAWCILAILIALVRSGSGMNGLAVVGLVALYGVCMIFFVKKGLEWIQSKYLLEKISYNTFMAILFSVLLLSSWCTEVIGIHALFGAFMAGIVIPKNNQIQNRIINRISDLTLVMLLPLFFVYTGLRTQAGIFNSGTLWISFAYILLCAVAGKFGGSAIVARILGNSWKESLSIGALMNTRGLMELVVLNIGYDMGILSMEIFSLMVFMALLTTMMTSPLLDWINFVSRKKESTEIS